MYWTKSLWGNHTSLHIVDIFFSGEARYIFFRSQCYHHYYLDGIKFFYKFVLISLLANVLHVTHTIFRIKCVCCVYKCRNVISWQNCLHTHTNFLLINIFRINFYLLFFSSVSLLCLDTHTMNVDTAYFIIFNTNAHLINIIGIIGNNIYWT